MGFILTIAFIFFIGSLSGWVLELFFRRFISSANPERKWINPGFLVGPYLPLYGFGLCIVFLLANLDISFIDNQVVQKIFLFMLMAIFMTIIEYIAGIIFIKGMNIKLWDYTNEWGNIKGVICPKYSFFWAVLSALYYFFIHPYIYKSVYWLANNLSFSFFVGFFYGIFLLDFCYSVNIMAKVRKFASDNDIVVKYENLKRHIRVEADSRKEKTKFVFAFKSEIPLVENLSKYMEKYAPKKIISSAVNGADIILNKHSEEDKNNRKEKNAKKKKKN